MKDLQIEFDISGRYGQVAVGEIRGRLKKPIMIRTSPAVSPLIYVCKLQIIDILNIFRYKLTNNYNSLCILWFE